MANTRRHIDLAVDEVQDVRDAAERLIEDIDLALEDGEISLSEAYEIAAQSRRLLREAQEAVVATERANVAELIVASILREGTVSPKLMRQARDVQVDVAIPIVPLPPCALDESITA